MDSDVVYWLAFKEKRGLIPINMLDFILMKFKSMENFWNSDEYDMLDVGLNENQVDKLNNPLK